MPIDPDHGGPAFEDRQQVYAHLQLDEREIRHIESMIHDSGQRDVARAALTNVRVRHHSIKNGCARVLESHTCELVFAYELEFDAKVLGYYVQVPCRRVQRLTQHGRSHVSTAHLDFLVFRHDGIDLVECKPRAWLDQRSQQGADWTHVGEQWSYAPYAGWAAQHGLSFSVWAAPEPPGVYLQNLEACYAVRDRGLDRCEQAIVDRALALIRRQPMSIEALTSDVPGFDARLALWMLAHARAFGLWKSTPIALADRFHLYADPAQAQAVDGVLLQAIAAGAAQPTVTDPLLSASATDLAKARERLARLAMIENGDLPLTRRMQQLARQVRKAVASGDSPLSACLTRYAHSGNHHSRLLPEQAQAIETVIARYWHTGKAHRPKDLLFAFEQECERLGVTPCGRARLDARRREASPLRHALATGGFRAYHAQRPSTDPRTRSLAPLGYGQVLHIDASDLDVRCAPDLVRCLPASKAKFYLGVDGATGDTMAHALIFGPARTDGLALLLREYVRRHAMLPRTIHVDRGPENTSHWMREFCDGRISLRHSPTAASAWNGLAENAIKQVNDQVAHMLAGSTAPDQRGRKVDGRFKSHHHARTAFTTLQAHFIDFLYGDLPLTPRADGQTPAEKKAQAIAAYGVLGTPCAWNDDVLIQTSVRLPPRGRPNVQRGIRTADGWFSSDALLAALRTHRPEQVRSDCCDPSVLYVRIAGAWIKAFHNRVQSLARCSDPEKLFELLWAPIGRAGARQRREAITRARHTRRQLAEFARPAIAHLAPVQEAIPSIRTSPPHGAEALDEVVLPFEEREDY